MNCSPCQKSKSYICDKLLTINIYFDNIYINIIIKHVFKLILCNTVIKFVYQNSNLSNLMKCTKFVDYFQQITKINFIFGYYRYRKN